MVELLVGCERVVFNHWKFPAGEVGVKLPKIPKYSQIDIIMKMPTSDDIFICLNILNALSRQGIDHNSIILHIPYVPYGRQDRVCHDGESHALEVFSSVLKAYPYFRAIRIKDPHSQATIDLLQHWQYNLIVEDQAKCAERLPKFFALIAPDKGAAEKVLTHSQIRADGTRCHTLSKTRKDGQVIYEDAPYDTIRCNVCVVDDICDGGATFLALAEMLKRTQPNLGLISLYVTHGIFSKGTDELLKLYDTIYVHNNMNQSVADSVTVI